MALRSATDLGLSTLGITIFASKIMRPVPPEDGRQPQPPMPYAKSGARPAAFGIKLMRVRITSVRLAHPPAETGPNGNCSLALLVALSAILSHQPVSAVIFSTTNPAILCFSFLTGDRLLITFSPEIMRCSPKPTKRVLLEPLTKLNTDNKKDPALHLYPSHRVSTTRNHQKSLASAAPSFEWPGYATRREGRKM